MKLTEKIKVLCDGRGETIASLERKMDFGNGTIRRWDDKAPSVDRLLKVANYFNVPIDYFFGENNLTGKEKQEPKLPTNCVPVDFNKMQRIPLLGQVAAGLPLYAEENIEGYTYTELNGGAEYFALRVKGDSMDAMGIKDGYIVIVRRQSIVEDGEVAVVMVDDENATMKRFYRADRMVTLLPQSNNPEHKPQIYDLAKTKVEVIGKVVKVEFML